MNSPSSQMPYARACIVEFGKSQSSSSAVYLQNGLVLCHAAPLLPLLPKPESTNHRACKHYVEKLKQPLDMQCVVSFERKLAQEKDAKNLNNKLPKQLKSRVSKMPGRVMCAWRCDVFSNTLETLFPRYASWDLSGPLETQANGVNSKQTFSTSEHTNGNNSLKPEDLQELLSFFVLIKLDARMNDGKFNPLKIVDHYRIERGDLVEIQATPFGSMAPDVFLNSVSGGVISNKAGQALILTDARCVPGTEGGPVYYGNHHREHLLGVVVAPLCWKGTEWVGLSIVCSAVSLLQSIPSDVFNCSNLSIVPITSGRDTGVHAVDDHVVLVQVPGSWGSGVHLGNGLIITCSHVVKGDSRARVRTTKGQWMTAQVVYACPGAVFDIALLQLPPHARINTTELPIRSAKQGEAVRMYGHALFGKEHDLEPGVTRGVIATVVKHAGIDVLLQGSCAVHSGASGGALVSEQGDLLGMVVCNTKDTTNNSTYPHLSLSVPMATVWPVIQRYIQTRDLACLNDLNVQSKYVENLWALKKESEDGSLLKSKL